MHAYNLPALSGLAEQPKANPAHLAIPVRPRPSHPIRCERPPHRHDTMGSQGCCRPLPYHGACPPERATQRHREREPYTYTNPPPFSPTPIVTPRALPVMPVSQQPRRPERATHSHVMALRPICVKPACILPREEPSSSIFIANHAGHTVDTIARPVYIPKPRLSSPFPSLLYLGPTGLLPASPAPRTAAPIVHRPLSVVASIPWLRAGSPSPPMRVSAAVCRPLHPAGGPVSSCETGDPHRSTPISQPRLCLFLIWLLRRYRRYKAWLVLSSPPSSCPVSAEAGLRPSSWGLCPCPVPVLPAVRMANGIACRPVYYPKMTLIPQS